VLTPIPNADANSFWSACTGKMAEPCPSKCGVLSVRVSRRRTA
jgi:hypothetical protein